MSEYTYPLSDTQLRGLAEFTVGTICGTDGIPIGEMPEAIPYAGVQACVEGRVSNWDELSENEYTHLVDTVQGEAECIISGEYSEVSDE